VSKELESWQELFAVHGHTVVVSDVMVPKRTGKKNFPIFVPTELTVEQIVTLFVKMAGQYADCGFFCHPIADMRNVRSAEAGSYVYWVTAGVYELHGRLYEATHDSTMTLIEKLLHEMWMWHHYKSEYVVLWRHGYLHNCGGTTRQERTCTLQYDPHDVKFCTRFFGS
jgi:hypothetical protein